jgi:hypothetical protein
VVNGHLGRNWKLFPVEISYVEKGDWLWTYDSLIFCRLVAEIKSFLSIKPVLTSLKILERIMEKFFSHENPAKNWLEKNIFPTKLKRAHFEKFSGGQFDVGTFKKTSISYYALYLRQKLGKLCITFVSVIFESKSCVQSIRLLKWKFPKFAIQFSYICNYRLVKFYVIGFWLLKR